MKKKLIMILSAAVFLFPRAAKADDDLASNIQEKLSSYQYEINEVLEKYTYIQVKLQGIHSLRDGVDMIKAKVKEEVEARLANLKTQAMNKLMAQPLTLKGIGSNLNMGDFAGPGLTKAVRDAYTRKAGSKNDLVETDRHNKELNELLVQNVAAMYANALVHRKKLQDDGKKEQQKLEEQKNIKDLPTMINAYSDLMMHAHARWISILKSISDYEDLVASGRIAESRVKNLDEAKTALETAAEAANADIMAGMSGGLKVGDIYGAASNAFNHAKDGNYAGLLGDAAGAYGNFGMPGADKYGKYVNGVANTLPGAVNNLQNGNYVGLTQNLANGYQGLQLPGQENVSNMIAAGAGSLNGVVRGIESGNAGNILQGLAGGASAVGSAGGNNILQDIGSGVNSGVNAYNSGVNAVNNLQNGNYQGAINNATNAFNSAGDVNDAYNAQAKRTEERNRQMWQSFNNSVEENNKAMAEEQKQRQEQQNQQIMNDLRQGVMESMKNGD